MNHGNLDLSFVEILQGRETWFDFCLHLWLGCMPTGLLSSSTCPPFMPSSADFRCLVGRRIIAASCSLRRVIDDPDDVDADKSLYTLAW